MLVPKTWLEQFISLEGISDKDFAQEMTFAGNKVESIHGQGKELVYEFEITSNRPDTLSVVGLAREAAAVFDLPLNLPEITQTNTPDKPCINIKIESPHLMPAYSAILLDNVTIAPSPDHIQQMLQMSDINPVNNVVDITNYLMHQTGQPIHAFDADAFQGNLLVRVAKAGETITPLDHKKRTLAGGEIIIEDEEKLIDLAGLMGGLNSEITEATKRVYLMVAVYDPVSIRRASKTTKIRTPASTRFEKQIDLTQTLDVLHQATNLMSDYASAQTASKIDSPEVTIDLKEITLTPEEIYKKVGIDIDQDTINATLAKLGINKVGEHQYQPPSYRRDLNLSVDLVEEVVRIYGYNKLPRTIPTGEVPLHQDATKPNWLRLIRDFVVGLGYTETYASTLTGKEMVELSGHNPQDLMKVLHSMSSDYEYMRSGIIQTMIPFLKDNLSSSTSVDLFEIGAVFYPSDNQDELPEQPTELLMVSTSKDYRRLKSELMAIGSRLNLTLKCKVLDDRNPSLEEQFQAAVLINDQKIGYIGKLSQQVLVPDDTEVMVIQLNLSLLMDYIGRIKTYTPIPNQPPLIEDYTFAMPTNTYLGPVIRAIKSTHDLIESVTLKDIYSPETEKLPANSDQLIANYTFSLTYRHSDRPLSDEEIMPIRKKIVQMMETKFQANLVGKLE